MHLSHKVTLTVTFTHNKDTYQHHSKTDIGLNLASWNPTHRNLHLSAT